MASEQKHAAGRGAMKPIPIVAGGNIAEQYGYDQIVIIARRVGDGGGEHVTTYGRDKAHCAVAARTGDFLKHKVMGWPEDDAAPDLLSIAKRWAALDGGAWHAERHAREKDELLADTRAAIAKAESQP